MHHGMPGAHVAVTAKNADPSLDNQASAGTAVRPTTSKAPGALKMPSLLLSCFVAPQVISKQRPKRLIFSVK